VTDVYNPLDIENLGQSVMGAILNGTVTPLGALPAFKGAAVYAIYYTGAYACYSRVAERNRNDRYELPIYVGKAVPSGGRKGVQVATTTNTVALRSRLIEHGKSIMAASNLDLADFWVRWLVVEPIWIPLGESLLISRFNSVWNALIDGFGNHDPGEGRIRETVSRWDTLHPGRPWAHRFPPRLETDKEIRKPFIDILSSLVRPLSCALTRAFTGFGATGAWTCVGMSVPK